MSGHDKIFESRSQQQAERAARLQQREEQDMNCHKISTIFQLPHSEGLRLMCLPGLTQTDSKGNAEDMVYQQPRPGCSHHQDTVTLTFPRGAWSVLTSAVPLIVWDCLTIK
ncbi:hypothetical protein GWK47_043251 [Chionoecetes opilio]|uniref:Uncharacterized protein n=1 Tax=Chionoecetes opilio TaxID=41210 RepID=A0A8J4YH59_CHIOP|nr:hypothetical protein GWK47_043251 [Chionoecetes opilio]